MLPPTPPSKQNDSLSFDKIDEKRRFIVNKQCAYNDNVSYLIVLNPYNNKNLFAYSPIIKEGVMDTIEEDIPYIWHKTSSVTTSYCERQ